MIEPDKWIHLSKAGRVIRGRVTLQQRAALDRRKTMVRNGDFHQVQYCSGLWRVPGNAKNSTEHYNTLLPKTIDLLAGHALVFHSDDDEILSWVASLCQERDIKLSCRKISTRDLPGWDISSMLVSACAQMSLDRLARPKGFHYEKGVTHYWRDFKDSGPDTYRTLLAIWMSKISLAETAAAQCMATDLVVWVDASVSRFRGTRQNDDFSKVYMHPDKLNHYGSMMKQWGIPLPLNASVLGAKAVVWPTIARLFEDATQLAANMPYGHDEETILAECVRTRPDLFHCLGRPIQKTTLQQLTARTVKRFARPLKMTRQSG